MYYEVVGFDRSGRNLGDVVYEENALATNVEAVGRLIDLCSHAARRVRAQRLAIAIVPSENTEQCHAALMERRERERRAVVPSVHHHTHAALRKFLEKV